MRSLRAFAPLLATALLWVAVPLGAAEGLGPALERLARQKPLVHQDGAAFFWGSAAAGPARFAVATYDAETGLDLDTDAGRVRIGQELATADDATLADSLADLVGKAKAGGVTGTDEHPLQFNRSLLVDLNLRGEDLFVCAQGVLRRQEDLPEPDAKGLRQELDEAITAAQDTMRKMALPELARLVTNGFLARLRLPEDEGAYDEYPASFARSLVCNGWLTQLFGDAPAGRRLTDAVRAVELPRPLEVYRGGEAAMTRLGNVFGKTGGGWLFTAPGVKRLVVRAAKPEYHFIIGDDNWRRITRVVIDLDPAADPLAPSGLLAKATGVRCVRIGRNQPDSVLASWTRAGGFEADEEAWRKAYPDKSRRGLNDAIAKGIMPPHIAVLDLWNNLEGIIVPQGILLPPQDNSDAEAARFIADAARLLPDAPHLDLVGQYCFQYVHDSPDPTRRWLLGLPKTSSDIHQTAQQTLGTTAGGRCRGDCDDLSELYEQIVEAQGKTAHVISLPSHAAVAWAEQRDDDTWHVFIMQTGQTLEFVDQRLQEALAKAYKSFGADEAFDPNGLGLLLRFSGENTRSSWRLSYRIFSEPDYARTMIDIQRDWHFQTYLQGIKKVLAMIAAGDEDTANYRELAGLYNFTGQYGKAAEYEQLALDRTTEDDSRLYMQVEMVGHLFKAERKEDALQLTRRILDQLPAMERKIGAASVQLGLQLVGSLVEAKEYGLAAEALDLTSVKLARFCITQLDTFIQSDEYSEDRWRGSSQIGQIRRVATVFGLGARLLLDAEGLALLETDERIRTIAGLSQRLLDRVAFYDAENDGSLMTAYAAAGTWYLDVFGQEQFDAWLEAAEVPTDKLHDHRQRIGGVAQVKLDLPWIKISPMFWAGLLGRLTKDEEQPVDREAVKRIGERLAVATAALEKLGMDHAFIEKTVLQTRMTLALLLEDEDTVVEILKHVKEQDDKRTRDDITQLVGDLARHLSDPWFDTVVQRWTEIVDYKPKYYWIAWRAALGKAPKKALRVAAIAAEKFKDDPAFVEEYKFMKELLDK